MKKIRAAVIMPFADFWRPLEWNDYPSLGILDRHLKMYGAESRIIDINEEFYRKVFSRIELGNYETDEPRRASLVYFLRRNPGLATAKDEFYEELMRPFSYFGSEYGEDTIHSMSDAERKMESAEGKKMYNATEEIIKDRKFEKDLFLVSVPTKVHIISALMLGKLLKKYYPRSHICFGGPAVTVSKKGQWFVDNGYCDTFITGPGERKVAELLRKLKEKPKGEIYAAENKKIDINLEINESPSNKELTRVVLSTGCPWGKCRFCDYPNLNAYFAIKRIDILIKELENLIENHGKRNFYLITDAIPPGLQKCSQKP